ncbi:MAG: putative glycoside hydrolase [Acidimicrobiales bacterium]
MAPSLRDIPGSNRPRKRFASARERDLWAPSRQSGLDLTPRSLRLDRARPFGHRRQVDLGIIAIAVAALGLLLWMGTAFWSATRVHVEVAGLTDGTSFRPDAAKALDITIRMPESDDRYRAAVTVDGVEVLDSIDFVGDTLRLKPAELVSSKLVQGALEEGPHTIALSVGRLFLPDAEFRWRYAVDSVAPTLTLPDNLDPTPIDEPLTLHGEVEPDATLRMNGEDLDVDNGRFSVTFERPPTGTLRFEATDAAGNWTVEETVLRVRYPDTSRAVHVSASGWANAELQAGVLTLIDEGRIDTVELDLKDESGVIGYPSEVPMAKRIGAIRAQFDLAEAVRTLERRGVRIIGRLVAFRDPIYAAAAWSAGRKDEVLQTPGGEMLSAYGGFANYVHPAVQKYNLDIALEAVTLGVHDILWDYIRRPEGAPDTMVVPGLKGASADVVAGFLGRTHKVLRDLGAYQGASVFGIAARSGDSIAQDVPAMARVVDYLAPMIYPSHWGPGQYGVARPIREPHEITVRALSDFQRVAAGSGVQFLPWIQDFTLYNVPYGVAEVRAQIDAAESLGIHGFLLWNPNVRYTAAALSPIAATDR